jgi:hypothetical protein
MVFEKDIVAIKLTEKDFEEAKGRLIQIALKFRPDYVNKSNEELISIVEKQIWIHENVSVGIRDDAELVVCKGILLEDRGVTEEQLERIWYGVIMASRHNGRDCSTDAYEEHPDWWNWNDWL